MSKKIDVTDTEFKVNDRVVFVVNDLYADPGDLGTVDGVSVELRNGELVIIYDIVLDSMEGPPERWQSEENGPYLAVECDAAYLELVKRKK